MILKNDVLAILPVAQEMSDRGIRLEAKPGPLTVLASELELVMGYTHSMDYEDGLSVAGLADQISIVSESLNKHKESGQNLTDMSSHDRRIDEMATLIASGVSASISKAKLVVIPLIKRIEDTIDSALMKYEDRSVFNFGITEIGIHEVLDCDSIYEYFEQYKGNKPDSVVSFKVFPEIEELAIQKLIETGSPEVTEYLSKIIQKSLNGVEAGKWIYDSFFREDPSSRNNPATVYNIFRIRSIVKECWGDASVVEAFMIAHYLAKGLLENIPDGTNASAVSLETSLNKIANSFGSLVFGELDHYRASQKNKKLLPHGLPTVNKENGAVGIANNIYVDREVYAEFLSNGGAPEVILGSMVSDRITNMQSLLDRSEFYRNKYDQFAALNHEYTTTNKLGIYSNAIRREFVRSIKEEENIPENAALNGAVNRLDKSLKKMGGDHITTPEKLYLFLRGAVCDALYEDDPLVEGLISDMDSYSEDAGKTMAEWSALAITRRTVDWLSEGIVLKK